MGGPRWLPAEPRGQRAAIPDPHDPSHPQTCWALGGVPGGRSVWLVPTEPSIGPRDLITQRCPLPGHHVGLGLDPRVQVRAVGDVTVGGTRLGLVGRPQDGAVDALAVVLASPSRVPWMVPPPREGPGLSALPQLPLRGWLRAQLWAPLRVWAARQELRARANVCGPREVLAWCPGPPCGWKATHPSFPPPCLHVTTLGRQGRALRRGRRLQTPSGLRPPGLSRGDGPCSAPSCGQSILGSKREWGTHSASRRARGRGPPHATLIYYIRGSQPS